MAGITEYARTCTDAFEARPLTNVDSLVLSCLSYLWIPEEVPDASTPGGVPLSRLGDPRTRLSLAAPCGSDPTRYDGLLEGVARSPRFSGVRASLAYQRSDEADEQQFAAVTFRLPDGSSYVAFRGTDDTLVGWKEDFNMSFSPSVPAQETARAYLELVAATCEGPLYVGGHSKGGNLAVYAVMTVGDQVRGRVVRCFSHDGPGFTDETTEGPRWAGAYDLVEKTVPGESLVGLLLGRHGEAPLVVRSTRAGIFQHDPFSWVVEGDAFVLEKALSYDAYRTGRRLNAWLRSMATDERERFVNVLYRLVKDTGEVTFSGMVRSVSDGSLQLMLRRLDTLSEADRDFFLASISELAATMLLGPPPTRATTPAERVDVAAERVDDITARFNDTMARWEHLLDV